MLSHHLNHIPISSTHCWICLTSLAYMSLSLRGSLATEHTVLLFFIRVPSYLVSCFTTVGDCISICMFNLGLLLSIEQAGDGQEKPV